MIFLGIESSGEDAGVALVREDGVIGSLLSQGKRNHSVVLASMVQDLLKEKGLALGDLSGISVDVGPGSFTGIRIGMTLAASLAYGADLPLVGVTSLEVLAHRGKQLHPGLVIPMIHARQDEVYVRVQGKERVVSIGAFLDELGEGFLEERVLFIGDGALAFADDIRARGFLALPLEMTDAFPTGIGVGQCGLVSFGKGILQDPFSLEANYLRRTEAEVNLERRLQE